MSRQLRHTPAGMVFHVINFWRGAAEDWLAFVNEPQGNEELEAIRRSVNRGCPFGNETWVQQVAEDLDLQQTLRPLSAIQSQSRGCQ